MSWDDWDDIVVILEDELYLQEVDDLSSWFDEMADMYDYAEEELPENAFRLNATVLERARSKALDDNTWRR